MSVSSTLEDRFAVICAAVQDSPGVALPDPGRRRFGSQALTVGGAIFAMLQGGRLVVKLPAERVRDLITSGGGAEFGAGRGRPMKEWVALVGDDLETELALTREALAFVGSRSRS